MGIYSCTDLYAYVKILEKTELADFLYVYGKNTISLRKTRDVNNDTCI